jgi:hypothetical protein
VACWAWGQCADKKNSTGSLQNEPERRPKGLLDRRSIFDSGKPDYSLLPEKKMTLIEILQFFNVLLIPELYYLHNIDKRITVIETMNQIQRCMNCENHKAK